MIMSCPEGFEKEDRPCKACKYSNQDVKGWYCSKRLMGITPDMNVCYEEEEGTCFEPQNDSN